MTALAAATLAACGSSGTSSTGTTAPADTAPIDSKAADTKADTGNKGVDACSLLTVADVDAAAGGTFGAGRLESKQQTPFGTYTVCAWSEQAHPLTTVRVSTWEKATAYDAGKGSGDENTPISTALAKKAAERL